MRRDQPDLLALAAGMDRFGERRDFALGRLQIGEPQLGVARESDPHRFVRRPFGEGGLVVMARRATSPFEQRQDGGLVKPDREMHYGLAEGRGIHVANRMLLLAAAVSLRWAVPASRSRPTIADDATAFGTRESAQISAIFARAAIRS